MNYPKFSVGEDVLICSKSFPELQGFATVIVARWWDDKQTRGMNTGNQIPPCWTYDVSPDSSVMGGWAESALRKRPSDFTYNELMDSLKAPVLA